ncbi:MAG: substrate-binding domain-containing protein [Azospirillaceae bacterium]
MRPNSLKSATTLAAGLAVAFCAAGAAHAQEADPELMLRSMGTAENINDVVLEAFTHASMDLSEEDRALALQCWNDGSCDTGRGELTVALADGFGENVWRRVTAMEFIMQALTYPEIARIIYVSARGDASKAISDMRSLIAQGADIIITFPDAGPALLPAVREATEEGITVVPYIAGLGGEAGEDYLTFVAEDLCELGRQFVQFAAENNDEDSVEIVELGGTPGNQLSAAWQACSEEVIEGDDRLSLLGTADTNWTQEGTFEAMSSFLSQHDDIDAVLYEYADGFRGGVRAYEAAERDMDLILALRTDEQGLFCDWEDLDAENFRIFYSSGGSFQSRIALTAAMMHRDGQEVPPMVDVPFLMKEVEQGICNPDLPDQMPVSTAIDSDMLGRMFQ